MLLRPSNLRKQLKGANYPAPHHIMAAAVEGGEQHQRGALDAAAKSYERALAIDGHDGHARYLLARVRLQQGAEALALAEAVDFNAQYLSGPALRAIVLDLPRIKEELLGKTVKKFIVVKKQNVNNIVNIVAG